MERSPLLFERGTLTVHGAPKKRTRTLKKFLTPHRRDLLTRIERRFRDHLQKRPQRAATKRRAKHLHQRKLERTPLKYQTAGKIRRV